MFLAIYHCSVKIIGRSKGKSVIAAAAHRVGEKLCDRETGITHDFTRKGGVMHREILLPGHAPEEYTDRQTLWESVTKAEKKSNAQLAREVEVALPTEFSEELQLAVIREYVQGNFVSEGMCADIAIHDKRNGNSHAHILLTTRPIKADGSWGAKEKKDYARDENGERIPLIDKKTRMQKLGKRNEKLWKRITVQANDWNDQGNVEKWRKLWADACNCYLSMEQQIDHRFGDYSSGEQIDSLLNQLEEMEQELTDKNEELKDLWNQVQEKDRQIRNLSSGSQKLKSQIQSMKSVLSEQGETLRHQTEQLERYSGSDIIFQENGRLKAEMEKAGKRGKEMEERAAAVLARAGRKEETAERKLAMANRLMAEYEETLAREVEKARRILQKWKKRWGYYECKNMELFKKSVMTGIAFRGFSISLAVMKMPFISIRLNVVSWWMIITGIMECMYFYYDGHDFW